MLKLCRRHNTKVNNYQMKVQPGLEILSEEDEVRAEKERNK